MKDTTTLNQSLMTNRRCQIPLSAEGVFGRAVHASTLVPASVAYLHRSATR
jgi:hypothetical protein